MPSRARERNHRRSLVGERRRGGQSLSRRSRAVFGDRRGRAAEAFSLQRILRGRSAPTAPWFNVTDAISSPSTPAERRSRRRSTTSGRGMRRRRRDHGAAAPSPGHAWSATRRRCGRRSAKFRAACWRSRGGRAFVDRRRRADRLWQRALSSRSPRRAGQKRRPVGGLARAGDRRALARGWGSKPRS